MPRMEAVSVALSSLVHVVYHLGCPSLVSHLVISSYDEEQEIVSERLIPLLAVPSHCSNSGRINGKSEGGQRADRQADNTQHMELRPGDFRCF
jgi:hypothetical protein